MSKENLLISSCLYGESVRYDGEHNKIENSVSKQLKEKYNLFHFCPELAGGLPVPRNACEIIFQKPLKIIDKNGLNQTKAFVEGAEKTLEFCIKYNIKIAILKSNSPSCSSKNIYDGSFTGMKIEGDGCTTELLKKHKIKVIDETDIHKILD